MGVTDQDHLGWLARHGLPRRGSVALDLGCGSGYLCRELARRGARHVVGVDVMPADPACLDAAWRFVQTDLDQDDWTERVARDGAGSAGSFDLICGFDVIEHLASPVRFVAGCHRLLAPQGVLVLTTPNTNSWERLVRGDRWSGATDPQHRILFTRYSLRLLVEREGFRVDRIDAPIRALGARGIPHPAVGGQLVCLAKKSGDAQKSGL
jgi:SAM-dependent methyltransferase